MIRQIGWQATETITGGFVWGDLGSLKRCLLAQSQGHQTINSLEERGGHKAKDIRPLIAWRREGDTKPRTSHHRSPGVKRNDRADIDRQEEIGVERGSA